MGFEDERKRDPVGSEVFIHAGPGGESIFKRCHIKNVLDFVGFIEELHDLVELGFVFGREFFFWSRGHRSGRLRLFHDARDVQHRFHASMLLATPAISAFCLKSVTACEAIPGFCLLGHGLGV